MTGDVNIADRLGQMNEAWNDAEASSGGTGVPPDGDYQALVNGFDWKDNDWGLQLETELQITSGDYVGRQVKTWHNVEDPEKVGWAKTHLAAMGLDVDAVTIQDLYTDTGHLEGLLDVPVEIRIKRNTVKKDGQDKTYTNIYVNQRLGPPVERDDLPVAQEPTAAASSSTSDDDIPF
jgi:hypothetical protein